VDNFFKTRIWKSESNSDDWSKSKWDINLQYYMKL